MCEAAAARFGFGLEWQEFAWGSDHYFEHGTMMPADGWTSFGPRRDLPRRRRPPRVPDHITLHGLLLPMRRRFDQYVNLRPAYLFDGVPCPLVGKKPG